MSWKSIMILPGGERASNACRYATQDEAKNAGLELLSRWYVPTDCDTEESDEPVNYVFTDGHSKRLENA